MANTFKVKIITPEKTFYEGESTSLVVPGSEGYLGILCDHAPLVTPLGKGTVTMKLPDKSVKEFELEDGFMEVSNNQALLLAEKITSADKA
jgi:F-type H+-transporting ATPase subunit epsilon